MEPSVPLRSEPYPEIEPYTTDRLVVSDIHELYYEQCGNPTGNPVIYLHGGPGSGSRPNDRRSFDPDVYRIILFDQRGAGKSTPAAELRENTTWELVADIEKLRTHLGIDRWQVFGTSWGSTLALAYAETHTDRVKALVIGGIFLSQRHEITWLFQSGSHVLFPDVWEEYIRPIPEMERDDFVSAYYRRLTGKDEKVKLDCARAWTQFEIALSKLNTSPAPLCLPPADDTELWDIQRATKCIIECHYFVNRCFLEKDDQLLANAHKLQDIPITIVHGRYDLVCPIESAWKLHKVITMDWYVLELLFVNQTGKHSIREPDMLLHWRTNLPFFSIKEDLSRELMKL